MHPFRPRLNTLIFLPILAYDISVFEGIWCLDRDKIILGSACRNLSLKSRT